MLGSKSLQLAACVPRQNTSFVPVASSVPQGMTALVVSFRGNCGNEVGLLSLRVHVPHALPTLPVLPSLLAGRAFGEPVFGGK